MDVIGSNEVRRLDGEKANSLEARVCTMLTEDPRLVATIHAGWLTTA